MKTEIRRLEKNQERKDNIHNLEYLKNVILKFMTLQPGTEKTGLIPVLETMLQVKIVSLVISRLTLIVPAFYPHFNPIYPHFTRPSFTLIFSRDTPVYPEFTPSPSIYPQFTLALPRVRNNHYF